MIDGPMAPVIYGESVKCMGSVIDWLTPATVTLLIEREAIVSRNAARISQVHSSRILT